MHKDELIWVSKEFAEKYNKLNSDEERIKVFEEYYQQISEASKGDFKANLEGLEEDVAIYTGLMLKVKQAFEKAKTEQLTASYDLWEHFEKEIPSTQKKIDGLVNILNPLVTQLDEVNAKLNRIRTFDIERLNETLARFESLSEKGKRIFQFVLDHFQDAPKEG